jgi:hypothetical protein
MITKQTLLSNKAHNTLHCTAMISSTVFYSILFYSNIYPSYFPTSLVSDASEMSLAPTNRLNTVLRIWPVIASHSLGSRSTLLATCKLTRAANKIKIKIKASQVEVQNTRKSNRWLLQNYHRKNYVAHRSDTQQTREKKLVTKKKETILVYLFQEHRIGLYVYISRVR